MGARQRETTTGGRGETILVVDDDPTVRHIVALSLESYGYRVLEAESGADALGLCRIHAGPIHMLLTDMVIPGMNGLELARQVMELRPDVHIMVMSGLVDNSIILNSSLKPNTPFFHKPFSMEELAAKVREILSGNS